MTFTAIERAQKRLQLIEQREQQIKDLKRLRREVRREITELAAVERERDQRMREGTKRYEARLITIALKRANGSVTHAAPMLAMSYQALADMLAKRHRNLAHLRKPRHARRGTPRPSLRREAREEIS